MESISTLKSSTRPLIVLPNTAAFRERDGCWQWRKLAVPQTHLLLLLLLLFLLINQLFGDRLRQLVVQWRIGGRYLDGHAELARGVSLKHSSRGRHVRIVAANRHPDVALAGQRVIGWVKADPAESRQQHLNPGMGRVLARTLIVIAMKKVSGDVAAWNAQWPHKRDHDVGEVLAYTLSLCKGLIDW